MKKRNKSRTYLLIIMLLLIFLTVLFYVIDIRNFFSNPEEEKIKKIINNMSIDEKIGQLLISSYNSIDQIVPVINEYKLGGVILYKNNINTVLQTMNDINMLKDTSSDNKINLFISIDQEGGRVNRLPSEMGTFPSAMSIGDKNDLDYAYECGSKIGYDLKELGFNLDFAPVLDIFSNPQNTVIGERAFGTTPNVVSKMGLQYIDGLHSENIIATAKHFPGHGDTLVDSHFGLPIVTKTLDQLKSFEFKPFVSAIKNNVDMIMIAHIILSKVDSLPSTLSHKVVTDILRDDLGYNGVIITDDMSMGAIAQNYTITDASIKAFKAGCDIILVKGIDNTISVINSLKASLNSGELTEDRIDESLYRILMLKNRYKLIEEE